MTASTMITALMMLAVSLAASAGLCSRADAAAPPCSILVESETPPGSPFKTTTDLTGLTVTEPAGLGMASVYFQTSFTVSGDFQASVHASRAKLGNAYLGIAVGTPGRSGHALQDIFFNAGDAITSNVFPSGTPTQPNSVSVKLAQRDADFHLRRAGNVITASYSHNAEFVSVQMSSSNSGYSVPVVITLFLIEAGQDADEHQGIFSRLRIVSAGHETRCW
jgi:hypothetical protein